MYASRMVSAIVILLNRAFLFLLGRIVTLDCCYFQSLGAAGPRPLRSNAIQCRPLILSLSMDARSSRSWFDKLTMCGSEWTLKRP